ncbi:MAG: tetratricopeptide repeat protein [Nitrospira sp.]|nr:tetratricopeptide repeat protein [Nitrospira sp.]
MWRAFLQSIISKFKDFIAFCIQRVAAFSFGAVFGYLKRAIRSTYEFFRDDFRKLIIPTLFVVFVGIFLYSYQTSPSILIEPFKVSEDLTHQGLTGHVITQKLLDEINLIKAKTRTSTFPRGAMLPGLIEPNIAPSWPAEGIDVPIKGTSLHSLIHYVASLFGRDVRIGGDIVQTNNIWNATVRISSDPRPIVASSTELSDLLRRLAISTLRIIHPIKLAEYYHATHNRAALMDVVENIIRTGASKLDLAGAYNFWGLVLSDEKKYEEAISKYKKALEFYPEGASIHINWGNALHNWGSTFREDRQRSEKYKDAGLQFEKASKLDPKMAATYVNWGALLADWKKYSEAEDKYRMAFADPLLKSHAANGLALALEAQKKIPEAIKVYEEAIRTTPGLTIPYVNLAQLLGRQGRYKEGYAKLEEAAGIDPQAFEVYWAWGLILANENESGQAITKFEKAVSLHPRFDELHVKWGANLYALKEYDQAASHFRQAADINPNNPETYYNWGAALKELGALDEAIVKFEKSKELNPTKATELDQLIKELCLAEGRRLREEGRLLEAITKFKKSTEVDPKLGLGFFEWGLTLVQMKNFEASIPQFQKAYEIGPDSIASLVNWGLALLEQRKYAAAVTQFNSVLEKEPDRRDIHYLLGEAYLGLRDYGEAKEAFIRYLNKEPKGFYVDMARKFLQDMKVTGVVSSATQSKTNP